MVENRFIEPFCKLGEAAREGRLAKWAGEVQQREIHTRKTGVRFPRRPQQTTNP